MDRFQAIDVTNSSLGAHLYPSEEVYLLTPGVGLYSGPTKSLPHASGTIYLTSHRLFYVDDLEPHRHSCFVKLSLVRETQFYSGFLKSSPKVTLGFRSRQAEEQEHTASVEGATANGSVGSPKRQNSDSASLADPVPSSSNARSSQDWRLTATAADASANFLPTSSWVCRVCAFSNTMDPGASPNGSFKCSLCGVSTDAKDLIIKPQSGNASTPMLNSSLPTNKREALTTRNGALKTDGIACNVCTFSNHPSMLRCEMCDSPLATINIDDAALQQQQNIMPAGVVSPPMSSNRTPSKTPEPPIEETHNHVRLSFRKGGDRPFYETLKSTLKEKRWRRAANGDNQGNNNFGTDSRPSSGSLRRYDGQAMASNIDGRSAAAAASDDEQEDSVRSRRVGIEGILSAVDLQKREESSGMQDALRDLEALMMRAKKMVDFAESLNAKLNKQEAAARAAATSADGGAVSVDQEAANLIRSSMVQLGLPTPAITADMARDQLEYNIRLARELAGLLYASHRPLLGKGTVLSTPRSSSEQLKLHQPAHLSSTSSAGDEQEQQGCGILALDEVWCMWNRARGVALISPKELLNVLPFLSRLTTPSIALKTFSSGLKVLHTPKYDEHVLSARIQARLKHLNKERRDDSKVTHSSFKGLSTLTLAQVENCPVSLMAELLHEVELHLGIVVRDDHAGQVTWYLNPFTGAGS